MTQNTARRHQRPQSFYFHTFVGFCLGLVTLLGARAMIDPNPETVRLIQLGSTFLEQCADVAISNQAKHTPILECLREKADAVKPDDPFQADIWEALLSPVVLGQLPMDSQLAWWKVFKTSKETREMIMAGSIDSTPTFFVKPDPSKNPGQKLFQDEIAEALKKKPFEQLFDKRFSLAVKEKKEIKWVGTDAVAYLVNVKQVANTQYVLKAVRSTGSEFPAEFTIHEQLVKLFPNFIPAFVDKGHSTDDGHKFAFMVMQYVGISADRWTKFSDPSVRPTKDEAILFLRRSFDILKEIHAAGFAHNDCHANNWFLSRTSSKDFYLTDFGRTTEMKPKKDFGYIATDFWFWTREVLEVMIGVIGVKKDEAEFANKATEVAKKLKMELRKVLYVHPDDERHVMHYARIGRTTYTEQVKVAGIKEFLELAEHWLKTAMASRKTANKEEITRWTSSKGEMRKKRATGINERSKDAGRLVQKAAESQQSALSFQRDALILPVL